MINFENIEKNKINNFKSGDGYIYMKMYEDEENKIVEATLPKGSSIGYHCHETGFEIIRVISGEGVFNSDGSEEILFKNQVNYCKTGHFHGVKNIKDEDLVLYCIIKK